MEDKVVKSRYNFSQMRESSSRCAADWETASKKNCVDSRDVREKYFMESINKKELKILDCSTQSTFLSEDLQPQTSSGYSLSTNLFLYRIICKQ